MAADASVRWTSWRVLLGLCAFSATAVPRAHAFDTEAPRPVLLSEFACALVAEGELRELLSLELSPRPLQGPADAHAAGEFIRVSVRSFVAEAQLRVEGGHLERRQELYLDLEETIPAARARLLALTLSELVATLDMEAESVPTMPGDTPALAPPPLAFGARPARVWLGAGVVRQGTPRVIGPSLLAGSLWRLGALPLTAQGELDASWGHRTLALGELQTWKVAVTPSLALPVRVGRLVLSFAMGVRLGYVRLEGAVRAPASQLQAHMVSGPFWGPSMGASAFVPIHARWALRAALGLFYVVTPVRGLDPTGGIAYAFGGVPLEANLGACLSL
jgi:hypothetical protein